MKPELFAPGIVSTEFQETTASFTPDGETVISRDALAGGSDLFGQTPSARCSCADAFNNLVSKLEVDYIGYRVAVKGKRDAEYQRQVIVFRQKARHSSNDECVLVLQDFIRFFSDGHLFVQQNPPLSDQDVARLVKAAEQTKWRSEADVRRYLDARVKRLDPIEGVWYNADGQRFGIVRDHKQSRRDYVAVLLSEGVENWHPGQVKAEFRKLPDGSYTNVFYSGRHYPLRLAGYLRGERGGAALRRNGLLLHIPPITWGKAYPLKPLEQNLIDTKDPRRPVIRILDQSTVVVSVPSHSPEYRSLLERLVQEFRDGILKAENLIIDIRGDEGGSTGTTNVLMPFLITPSKRAEQFWAGDQTMILSSADNISYFKQVESQGWVPKHLIERMQKNPGKLVPFSDETSKSDSSEKVSGPPTEFPRHVAILMDGAVVSAGEAFVIQAMKNKKVTLFGENTGGVIDYQSVSIISLNDCPSLGFNLGYPMFAASNRLPLGGVNKTGIAPDVRIPRSVKDPIKFIVDFYSKGRH